MKINIIYLIIQGKRRRNISALLPAGESSSNAETIMPIGFPRRKDRWPSGPNISMKDISTRSIWFTRNKIGGHNFKFFLEKNEKVQNPQSCIWETKGRRHLGVLGQSSKRKKDVDSGSSSGPPSGGGKYFYVFLLKIF